MLVYQAAERTIHDAMAFLLRAYSDGRTRAPCGETGKQNFEFSNGVPSLCKFVEYLLGVIKEASDPPSNKNDGAAAAAGIQRGQGGHRRSLSQQQHVPYSPPLNEVTYDRSTLHLLFALKSISRLLSVGGNGVVVRDLLVR